jgi:hypothetical protein
MKTHLVIAESYDAWNQWTAPDLLAVCGKVVRKGSHENVCKYTEDIHGITEDQICPECRLDYPLLLLGAV